MKTKIEEIDAQTSAENLTNKNLSIENIVCTFNLNQEFDLEILNNYLDYTEYEPESFPFLVYRPQKKQGTILIPTNGKVSLVGCKKKEEVIQLAIHLIDQLSPIAPKELPTHEALIVQNIVVNGDLNHELDLSAIAVLLGIENTEYEPEQFPGVIYRENDRITMLLFSSGKFVVTGSTSYGQALSSVERLLDLFSQANIPIEL
jgi:transcription initiation factor TFIID TATA-box-binding protein